MKLIHKNKKAYFDYEILEEFRAGIVLTGAEIKSLRGGHVNLKGAYVSITDGEAFLRNAHISRYRYDSRKDYDPFRERKLLLQKKELHKIANSLNTRGITVVPLAVGLEGDYAKVTVGLARGRKKHDKRQVIRERSEKRQVERALKRHVR